MTMPRKSDHENVRHDLGRRGSPYSPCTKRVRYLLLQNLKKYWSFENSQIPSYKEKQLFTLCHYQMAIILLVLLILFMPIPHDPKRLTRKIKFNRIAPCRQR